MQEKLINRNERSSNIELLRIILMLSVVAHHYVTASGALDTILGEYGGGVNIVNSLLLQVLGAWGKTAINAFVLITGYFMCKSEMRYTKVLKLVLEIKFYEIAMYFILAILGYKDVTLMNIFKTVFSISVNINHSFVGSIVVVYLLIPYLNILIAAIKREEYKRLLIVLLGIYIGIGTFLMNFALFSHVSWYVTLYLVAGYIRLYPCDWMKSKRICCILSWISFILGCASIIGIYIVDTLMGLEISSFYFVSNSNKVLAFLIALFMFLWFLNIEIKHNIWINRIAATTFGVLLIHTNCVEFNEILWNKILSVNDVIRGSTVVLILHLLLSIITVHGVCTIIDTIRIKHLEKPIFAHIASWRRKKNSY